MKKLWFLLTDIIKDHDYHLSLVILKNIFIKH